MTWPSESQFGSILENCEIMNTATRELINCLLKKLYSMRAMSFSFIWGLPEDDIGPGATLSEGSEERLPVGKRRGV